MLDPSSPPNVVGRHLLADFYEAPCERLRDQAFLQDALLGALAAEGFQVLSHRGVTFPGEGAGASVIVLLSESHATIHTYPEYGYLALDIFSCGEASPERVLERLAEAVEPGRVEVSVHERGVSLADSIAAPKATPGHSS